MKRGSLIVFEGIDRCGKTTQCKILVDKLRTLDQPCKFIQFPNRKTDIGKIIDSYLKKEIELDDHAVHLLFSANRWELHSEIIQALKDGICVIVDRYSFSGVCFTGAKNGFDLDWCMSPEKGLPAPDIVFFLNLPIQDSIKRSGYGEERYENKEFQTLVLDNFEKIRDDSNWRILDATLSIEKLSEIIMNVTLEILKKTSYEIKKI